MGERSSTRRLEIFLVTGSVHSCPRGGAGSISVDPEPSAFLKDLRNTIGIGIGPIETTARLGNLPAVAADIDPTRNTCSNNALHEDGMGLGYARFEPTLDTPGKLIVGRTHGKTIAALISAATEEDLDSWLPIAQQYLDSITFEVAEGSAD